MTQPSSTHDGMESEGNVQWMSWKGTKRHFGLEMSLGHVFRAMHLCTELKTIRIIHASHCGFQLALPFHHTGFLCAWIKLMAHLTSVAGGGAFDGNHNNEDACRQSAEEPNLQQDRGPVEGHPAEQSEPARSAQRQVISVWGGVHPLTIHLSAR